MAEAWLHQDASVNVDVQSVADFAARMRAEIEDNFTPSLTEGINPMLAVSAPFGAGGGLGEGALFRDMHERNRMAATRLLGEVFQSLNALGQAAAAVAAEYAAGDGASATTVTDVYDAFTPTDASGTAATTVPTTTSAYTVPYTAPDAGNQAPPTGADPDRYPTTNPDAAVAVAPGTAGEYTIPADNEDMRTGAGPIPQPKN